MTSADLGDRYGAPTRWRRPALLTAVAVVAVAFLAWLAWAAWFHGTPAVQSELIGYEVVDGHRTDAVVEVSVGEGVAPSCRLKAYADDHTVVGELAFAGTDGRNDVVVRTERRATSLELVGCTAEGQNRPR